MTADSTRVELAGTGFLVDGEPTYSGTDHEGSLFNVRAVQAAFDDGNPETVHRWEYPDTGEWDPERNVREFREALPTWYEHGVRAVAVNLQGGRPVRNIHEGGTDPAAREQPWLVSTYRPDGTLKEEWLDRMGRVLDRADELGMVVILGLFYQGQDEVLADEESVVAGVENALEWLFERGDEHVLIEINNECDTDYDHEILGPERVHELLRLVRGTERDGRRYPASTSFAGGSVPTDAVIEAADFALLHGNGVDDPARIGEMVAEVRESPAYEPMPILFNEDDVAMLHGPEDGYGFGTEPTHLSAAAAAGASWGYYDKGDNDYESGFQCPPVNWTISTDRKRAFFEYLAEMTGVS